MASTKYTYSIAADTLNAAVQSDGLTDDIEASAIVQVLERIETSADVLDIWFDAALTPDDTVLTAVVAAHDDTVWMPGVNSYNLLTQQVFS